MDFQSVSGGLGVPSQDGKNGGILQMPDLQEQGSYANAEAEGTCRKSSSRKNVKFADKTPDDKAILTKPCAGHIGSQLGAVKPDGRPYKCVHGDRCTFRHVSVTGKTDQRLHDLVATMAVHVQSDLRKVISLKK
jgi:hypothetical protein